MSPEYKQALAIAKAASAKFAVAQKAYRARKIGDAEFLAAHREYDASTRAFDAAYAAEEARDEPDAVDMAYEDNCRDICGL